jgi:AcrR family transcriptional regulator
MTRRSAERLRGDRPRRGSPEQTRERLLEAAAEVFNRDGYHGTDSNQIAHEAGYATGTFYKHFKDKKDLFLAVYERWVNSEWRAVEDALSAGGTPRQIARTLVDLSIDFHTKWRGLRSSLLMLVFTDSDVRRFYRDQRRRQLDVMARLRKEIGAPKRTREEDAVHLYMTERVFDAIANGEPSPLGLNRNLLIEAVVKKVEALLS